MKNFFLTNWKDITLVIFGTILLFLIFKILTPIQDNSELTKYKLEQIEKKLVEIKDKQKVLSDSIEVYKKKIIDVDKKLLNIKIERKQVNNFYTIKEEEIKSADKKKIDSLLRKRYNF